MEAIYFGTALAAGIAAIAAAAAWAHRTKTQASSKASCGSCGYCVVDIPSWKCPECGSDLRGVGIFTPRMRQLRVVYFLTLSVLWSAVIVGSGLLVTDRAPFHFPELLSTTVHERRMQLSSPTDLFKDLRLTSSMRKRAYSLGDVTINVALTKQVTVLHELVAVFGESPRWTCNDPRGDPVETQGALTSKDLAAWLKSVGITPRFNFQQDEIDEVFASIEYLRHHPQVGSGQLALTSLTRDWSGDTAFDGGADVFKIASAAFWSFVWALGVYVLYRLVKPRAGRLREHRADAPSAEAASTAK